MATVRKRASSAVRRTQIIDAAKRVIIKYGSENVTVRRVAKEVGLSEGDLYRHFKSKRDILSFLLDDVEANLLADIEANSSKAPYALEDVERVLTNHMTRVVERRGVSFQVVSEIVSLGDKKLNAKACSIIAKYISRIKDVLSEGVKGGAVREDLDLDAAATLFLGMMEELVNIWTLSHYAFDLQEKYVSLWETLRKALVKY